MKLYFVFLLLGSSLFATPLLYNQKFVDCHCNAQEIQLINHIKSSIYHGQLELSHLKRRGRPILKMEGNASSKVRHFLNNLCAFPETVYLEVGVGSGATFIAALYGNGASIVGALAIDSWAAAGSKQYFEESCKHFLKHLNYTVFNGTVTAPITTFFYATKVTHELSYYHELWAPSFIFVTDDWGCNEVRKNTFAAFDQMQVRVLYEQSLPSGWNDLYVAVIRKKT